MKQLARKRIQELEEQAFHIRRLALETITVVGYGVVDQEGLAGWKAVPAHIHHPAVDAKVILDTVFVSR